MNLFLVGTIIFVLVYLLLNWFVKTSSRAIAQGTRKIILFLSIALAVLLAYGGKFLLSLPLTLMVCRQLPLGPCASILKAGANGSVLHYRRKRSYLILTLKVENKYTIV